MPPLTTSTAAAELPCANTPNAREDAALVELRKLVASDGLKCDDAQLRRFLRARDLDVTKARAMALKWQAWREEWKVDDLQEADFAAEAATGKARWHGADKKGQACVVVRPRLHNPSSTDATGLMRYGAFMMEQGVRLTEANGCESVCVIYDRLGMTRKNVDLGQMRALLGMVQDCYPERLGDVYVLEANALYHILYGMVKPFLTERTKSKIHLLDGVPSLLAHFEAKMLEEEYSSGRRKQP